MAAHAISKNVNSLLFLIELTFSHLFQRLLMYFFFLLNKFGGKKPLLPFDFPTAYEITDFTGK